MPATVWFGSGAEIRDSIKYKYDSCGNICRITQNGHIIAKYTYDGLNRLIREDNKKFGMTTLFTYDNAGNITERCVYAYTNKSGEELSELNCTHYSYDYDGDKLVSYNGEEFAYNNLGNPTTYRGKTATWLYGKLLASYNGISFTYNGNGSRASKGGITFTYDSDGRLVKQSNGLEFVYDNSGIAGVIYGGEQYFYRKDAQGNIIAILDSSGNVVVNYAYDAWGNNAVLDKDGNDISDDEEHIGNINPFRYRSYYYDTETELYFLQTRYYDPEVGRFISQDSVEYADPEAINGLNLYAYCGNNPVMGYDPTGTWDWGAFWRGLGRVLTGIAAVVVGALVVASGVAGIGMLVVAGVTIAAGALTLVNGASDVGEAFSDYNFVRDGIFQGNSTAYNWYSGITEAVAVVGTMICGGWLKYNAPRIKAYKNISNSTISNTLSDSTHMARPYQQSTLLQKQVIKYGKMMKEGNGIFKFLAEGSFRIGFDGGVHAGITWKLVMDITNNILLHFGHF